MTADEQRHHEWDDDGCCIHCGFDGAEWHWWKHDTYEGRAQPEMKMPRCRQELPPLAQLRPRMPSSR